MHATPLRYPGGKSKLAPLLRKIFRENSLLDGHYAEPYAGGAGVALELLFLEYASHIHLNDLDRAVYSFWSTVLNEPDWLCRQISDCALTIDEWARQREVYRATAHADPRELGFALFFLNRTNRSGILTGGVIGGLDQTGEWKMDARFTKPDLIARIQKIAEYRSRISLYNLDADRFISEALPLIPQKSLVYLDPPYFHKGNRLYQNHYKKQDHAAIALRIQSSIRQKWLVSYDSTPEITSLYKNRRRATYSLQYSAGPSSMGTEVMFFSDDLLIPNVADFSFFVPKGYYQRPGPIQQRPTRMLMTAA